jgi:hypothetical protein
MTDPFSGECIESRSVRQQCDRVVAIVVHPEPQRDEGYVQAKDVDAATMDVAQVVRTAVPKVWLRITLSSCRTQATCRSPVPAVGAIVRRLVHQSQRPGWLPRRQRR